MKLSICADIMYGDIDFCEKIKNIKNKGYDTIEFWQWSNKNIEKIKETIDELNVNISTFCIDSSSDNIMNKIGRTLLNSEEFEKLYSITEESIEIAKKLGTKMLIATVGDLIDEITYEKQIKNVYKSIEKIMPLFVSNDMTLLIEPINLQERPKYLTPNVKQAAKIVKDINCKNVKLLYDIYHQAMENDFSVENLLELLNLTGHIHIADCPGRHEPGTGNIEYKTVFDALKNSQYDGYIGAEFIYLQ